MFKYVLLIPHGIAIILIGAFAKAPSTASEPDYNLLASIATMFIAFCVIYSPYKHLALFPYLQILIVASLSMETYLLFGPFWDSCVTKSFQSSYTITLQFGLRTFCSAYASVMTCLDLPALLPNWKSYVLLTPIITIGYALASSINTYLLSSLDGGSSVGIFLYSATTSLVLWVILVRGKIQPKFQLHQTQYHAYTHSLIALAVVMLMWPYFNSILSNLNVLNTSLTSASSLSASAYGNTFFCLSVAVIGGLMLVSNASSQQNRPQMLIDCSGMICSTFSDILLDPSASMTLGLVGSLITLLYYRVSSSQTGQSQSGSEISLFLIYYGRIPLRMVCSILGVFITAIVLATRSDRLPQLLGASADYSIYSSKAGMVIAGMAVVLFTAAIFGLLAGLILKVYLSSLPESEQQLRNDMRFILDISQENYSLYPRRAVKGDIEELTAKKMLEEELLKQSTIISPSLNRDYGQPSLLNQQQSIEKRGVSLTEVSERDYATNRVRLRGGQISIRRDFSKSNNYSLLSQTKKFSMIKDIKEEPEEGGREADGQLPIHTINYSYHHPDGIGRSILSPVVHPEPFDNQ